MSIRYLNVISGNLNFRPGYQIAVNINLQLRQSEFSGYRPKKRLHHGILERIDNVFDPPGQNEITHLSE